MSGRAPSFHHPVFRLLYLKAPKAAVSTASFSFLRVFVFAAFCKVAFELRFLLMALDSVLYIVLLL